MKLVAAPWWVNELDVRKAPRVHGETQGAFTRELVRQGAGSLRIVS
jgi:hypothetical protein